MLENPWSAVGNTTSALGPLGSSFGPSSLVPVGIHHLLMSNLTTGWMCGIKLKDRLPSKQLRERLCVDDIALVLQQNRLRWYGHVLRKEDDD